MRPPWNGSRISRSAPSDSRTRKWPGKPSPTAVPALGPRGMQIEDAERHRQAFAAVDDPHQVGVLQIVVGQLVAAIAVFQQDDLVERVGARGKIALRAGVAADIARERRKMLAVARRARPAAARTRRAPAPPRRSAGPARPSCRARAESARIARGRRCPAARSSPSYIRASEPRQQSAARRSGASGACALRTAAGASRGDRRSPGRIST